MKSGNTFRIGLAVLVLALEQRPLHAATNFVSLSGNHTWPFTNWVEAATNIQSAVDAAQSGDTVSVEGGTYALFSEITISTNITVQGGGGPSVPIVDGCRTTRCFRLAANAGCVVRGFTITNGFVGTNECGGAVWMGSSNTLADCIVVGCEARAGGGVYAMDVVISNCTFLRNTAGWAGGGLAVSPNGGSFLVEGCTFTANSADIGGAVFCGCLSNSVEVVSNLLDKADYDNEQAISLAASLESLAYGLTNRLLNLATGPGDLPPPDSSLSPGRPEMLLVSRDTRNWSNVVRDCSACRNAATCGGGFFLFDRLDTVVSNCVLVENEARCGAGVCVTDAGLITESTVAENRADLFGGGIFVGGVMDMLSCHFSSNSAGTAAGGCWINDAVVRVKDANNAALSVSSRSRESRVLGSEFFGNEAGMLGGGLLLGWGLATSNTFFRNSALCGGGIASYGGVTGCVLVENAATVGAGILHFDGDIVRCVAEYNSAEAMGGGVYAVPTFFQRNAVAEACELHNNFAALGGGIVLVDSSFARRCTITSNTAGIAGGGVFTMLGGEVQTSLIRGNAAGDGAGIYCLSGGRVVNTTVTKNDALRTGGGLFVAFNPDVVRGWQVETNAVIANAIMYGNTASNAPNFVSLATNITYSYTCAVPLAPGTGNITNDPLLTVLGSLPDASPCVDAGYNDLMPAALDLAGVPRPLDGDNDGMRSVDMGCYEHMNSVSDSDGDSMPDGWELSHSFDLLTNDAQTDSDLDRMPNGEEYVSDTDPHDADSVLSFTRVDSQFGGSRLEWKGGRNAWQFLEVREDLKDTNAAWLPIFAIPPPTPLTNAVIDMGATNAALFYRLRAER